MEARRRLSTDHVLDFDPGVGSLLGPNLVEVGPDAESKEPDDGTGGGQIDHVGDEYPVEQEKATGNVVLLNHGTDRESPGYEETCA